MLLHMDRRTCSRRWCKACTLGPLSDVVKVRQGPIDFYFCSVDCATFWHAYRYDARLGPLFKMSATDSNRLSKQKLDARLPGPRDTVARRSDVPNV